MECCTCLQPWLHDSSSSLSSKGGNPNPLDYSESRHGCCSEFFPPFSPSSVSAAPSLDNLLCGDLSSVNHLCCVCKLQVISAPLSRKVLILRCQHFALDWLLKTILLCFHEKTMHRWEICSTFPSSVCLPGDLLCLTNASSWLQDMQNIPFAHRSRSVCEPSATVPCFSQFCHLLRFYLLIIQPNFKFNLLQIFQDSSSPHNDLVKL